MSNTQNTKGLNGRQIFIRVMSFIFIKRTTIWVRLIYSFSQNATIIIFFIITFIILGNNNCATESILITSSQDTTARFVYLGLRGDIIYNIRESKNYIYVCAGTNGLYRGGKSFTTINEWKYLGLRSTELGTHGVTDVAIIGNNDSIICAGFSNDKKGLPGLMRSTNGGQSWIQSDSNLFGNYYWGTKEIHCASRFAVSPMDSQLIFTINNWNSAIYWSHDAGASWNRTNNVSIMDAALSSIAIDKNNPTTIWAGRYLQRSTDNGISWLFVNSFLKDIGDYEIYHIQFGKPNEVFLLNGQQISYSIDNGEHWLPYIHYSDTLFVASMVVASTEDHHLFISANVNNAFASQSYILEMREGVLKSSYPFQDAIQTMTLINYRILIGTIHGGLYELVNYNK